MRSRLIELVYSDETSTSGTISHTAARTEEASFIPELRPVSATSPAAGTQEVGHSGLTEGSEGRVVWRCPTDNCHTVNHISSATCAECGFSPQAVGMAALRAQLEEQREQLQLAHRERAAAELRILELQSQVDLLTIAKSGDARVLQELNGLNGLNDSLDVNRVYADPVPGVQVSNALSFLEL